MREAPDWATEVDQLVEDLQDQLGYLPYQATPDHLYTAGNLYQDLASNGFFGCTDQRIYARAQKAGGPRVAPVESLAQRLHDHGITVALNQFCQNKRIVGVMGGHAMERGSARYCQVVELGRELTRAGFCVATGGGPGAMEAANLGAATSALSVSTVDEFVDRLAVYPRFADDVDGFTATAFDLSNEIQNLAVSLSVPTWFYGHEPSNPFASHIAKYFSNSEREDGLLAIATSGIVFVPGGPGTLQEVFQDAAQNAYETFGNASPMVFLDSPAANGTASNWWAESGVMATLDRAFTKADGSRRPGWELVANVASVDAVLPHLR